MLRVETSDLVIASKDAALQSLDFAAMLDGIEKDSAVRAAGANELAGIRGKLPGGVTTDTSLTDDLDALFERLAPWYSGAPCHSQDQPHAHS